MSERVVGDAPSDRGEPRKSAGPVGPAARGPVVREVGLRGLGAVGVGAIVLVAVVATGASGR